MTSAHIAIAFTCAGLNYFFYLVHINYLDHFERLLYTAIGDLAGHDGVDCCVEGYKVGK